MFMEDVEFRPGGGFSTPSLVRGCVALVFTAVLLTVGLGTTAAGLAWLAAIPGAAAVLLLTNYFVRRGYRTRLSPQGIEMRGWRTRSVPWTGIRDIQTVTFGRIASVPVMGSRRTGGRASRQGGANRKVATVRIQNSHGHWIELPAPIVTGTQEDPDFADKARRIREYWQLANGQPQTR
jgi:hypothetical protein